MIINNSFAYILNGFYKFFKFLMKESFSRSSSKKYAKNELFPMLFLFPSPSYAKNPVKMVHKQVFI